MSSPRVGTKDKVYDLIWFTEASLRNASQLENHILDAEREGDDELAEFFRQGPARQPKGR